MFVSSEVIVAKKSIKKIKLGVKLSDLLYLKKKGIRSDERTITSYKTYYTIN